MVKDSLKFPIWEKIFFCKRSVIQMPQRNSRHFFKNIIVLSLPA